MFRTNRTGSPTVLALMRAGRLTEATAEIQRSLGGSGPSTPGPLPTMPSFPGAMSSFPGGLPGMRLPGMRTGMPGAGLPGAGGTAPAGTAGTVTRGSVGGAAGTIAYRLHVPSRPVAPAPLLVMLHGGTQDAETFATATGMDAISEREGFLVVYPEQSRSANAMGYWNWFRPGDQRRDAGEPALIAAVVREVAAAHGIDAAAVAVAGFSAGAAMAAVMAATYPDLVCGAGVHSGLAYGVASDAGSAFAAMRGGAARVPDPGRVPLVVVHGDRDTTVDPRCAEAVVASGPASSRAGEESTGRSEGGRSWTLRRRRAPDGRLLVESWTVHGTGHAWSGGRAGASYTDPAGPNAGEAMVAFFGFRRPSPA